jgi:LPS-assembly protein
MESEGRLDNFYQMAGNATQRMDLAPSLRFSQPLPIGQISAALTGRETVYWIFGNPEQAPGANIDDGTMLHREAVLFNTRLDTRLARTYANPEMGATFNTFKHTWEPSIQYNLTGSTDQNDLPNYDARLRDLTTSTLFADNFLSGLDRVSEGQRITYRLTSRLLGRYARDGNQEELARFAIGQQWAPEEDREYLQDRAFSDLVMSMTLRLNYWMTANLAARYDPYADAVRTSTAGLAFAGDGGLNIAVDYHVKHTQVTDELLDEDIEDALVRAQIPITENWRWSQRVDYSLRYHTLKSWTSGLGYLHDCWGFEFQVGRELSSETATHSGAFVGVLLSLSGLGSYGIK